MTTPAPDLDVPRSLDEALDQAAQIYADALAAEDAEAADTA